LGANPAKVLQTFGVGIAIDIGSKQSATEKADTDSDPYSDPEGFLRFIGVSFRINGLLERLS
jgi:hypothetical protein